VQSAAMDEEGIVLVRRQRRHPQAAGGPRGRRGRTGSAGCRARNPRLD
jgi:hypothetical protein